MDNETKDTKWNREGKFLQVTKLRDEIEIEPI